MLKNAKNIGNLDQLLSLPVDTKKIMMRNTQKHDIRGDPHNNVAAFMEQDHLLKSALITLIHQSKH